MRLALTFLSFLVMFSVLTIFALAPDLVTYQQSHASAWWNDTIIVNGSARYENGTGIYDALVNITVGNSKCNNTTDSTGNYTCRFTAPLEVGKYQMLINITNSTGPSATNTSELDVILSYGETPIGTIDRAVYETPVLVQEMSGRIRVLMARIILWKR